MASADSTFGADVSGRGLFAEEAWVRPNRVPGAYTEDVPAMLARFGAHVEAVVARERPDTVLLLRSVSGRPEQGAPGRRDHRCPGVGVDTTQRAGRQRGHCTYPGLRTRHHPVRSKRGAAGCIRCARRSNRGRDRRYPSRGHPVRTRPGRNSDRVGDAARVPPAESADRPTCDRPSRNLCIRNEAMSDYAANVSTTRRYGARMISSWLVGRVGS